jgi:hypothetical protein
VARRSISSCPGKVATNNIITIQIANFAAELREVRQEGERMGEVLADEPESELPEGESRCVKYGN